MINMNSVLEYISWLQDELRRVLGHTTEGAKRKMFNRKNFLWVDKSANDSEMDEFYHCWSKADFCMLRAYWEEENQGVKDSHSWFTTLWELAGEGACVMENFQGYY